MSDDHLWKAYWSAPVGGAERKRLAGEIVEHHLGFLIDYARRNGQFSWSDEDRADYLQELVAVALARVDGYRGDMGAKFVTYLAPYLRPVRWKLIGNNSEVRVGYETARLTAECDRLVADGITDLEAIAAHLSALHGKTFGVERVRRIVNRPRWERGDRVLGDGGGSTVWDLEASSDLSVEDQAIANLEGAGGIDVEVAAMLAAAGLTDLERDIVVERLMASRRSSSDEGFVTLADRHDVTVSFVRDTERSLVVRLRSLLGPIVSEDHGSWQPPLPF